MQSCTAPKTIIIIERDIVVNETHRVEKEFIPYLTEFENRCSVKPELNVRFGILTGGTVGVCMYGNIKPNIIIDQYTWLNYSQAKKEVLMFHELAHCTLSKEHNEKKVGGRPVSIMYPYVLSKYDYEKNREEYIKELCN